MKSQGISFQTKSGHPVLPFASLGIENLKLRYLKNYLSLFLILDKQRIGA